MLSTLTFDNEPVRMSRQTSLVASSRLNWRAQRPVWLVRRFAKLNYSNLRTLFARYSRVNFPIYSIRFFYFEYEGQGRLRFRWNWQTNLLCIRLSKLALSDVAFVPDDISQPHFVAYVDGHTNGRTDIRT